MTDLEIVLQDIGELTTRELAKKRRPYGLEENKEIAKLGGEVVRNTRKDIEEKLGETIVSRDNNLVYEYDEEKLLDNR